MTESTRRKRAEAAWLLAGIAGVVALKGMELMLGDWILVAFSIVAVVATVVFLAWIAWPRLERSMLRRSAPEPHVVFKGEQTMQVARDVPGNELYGQFLAVCCALRGWQGRPEGWVGLDVQDGDARFVASVRSLPAHVGGGWVVRVGMPAADGADASSSTGDYARVVNPCVLVGRVTLESDTNVEWLRALDSHYVAASAWNMLCDEIGGHRVTGPAVKTHVGVSTAGVWDVTVLLSQAVGDTDALSADLARVLTEDLYDTVRAKVVVVPTGAAAGEPSSSAG